MSKKFFRFLRGELNGYYITAINNSCNKFADKLSKFMQYFSSMQFKTDDEVVGDETAMSASDINGIASFTGVYPAYVLQDSLIGSVKFTVSHKVDGNEYSERGLYSVENEAFSFVRTAQQEYSDDINTLANPNARSTLVESGRQPIGYFPEGENVIKDDGTIDETKLMPAPRPNHADSPYYGKDFLFLAEESPILAITSTKVLVYLIRAMQWVRYNGMSIASLTKFAEIICPDFLFIVNIDWDSNYAYAVVSYGIDDNFEAEDKLMREQLFALMAKKKLTQFAFSKVNISVERDAENNVISVNTI